MTLEDKIEEIDPEEYAEEDRAEMRQKKREWREQATLLNVQKDWIGHPATQAWLKEKQAEIKRIDDKLANDEGLDQRERDRLLGEKRAHKADFAKMEIDPYARSSALEIIVDDQLGR